VDDDASFPKISTLESKIKDVRSSQDPYIIEAIVLQSPNETEVSTKGAEVIPVTDTIIGDETGEIRLIGWRDYSSEISKLNVGDRIKIVGATGNSGMGSKPELTLRSYSSILKIT
jgi:replication factor A1